MAGIGARSAPGCGRRGGPGPGREPFPDRAGRRRAGLDRPAEPRDGGRRRGRGRPALRVPQRIRRVVELRLIAMAPHKAALRRALALLALPWNAPQGLRATAGAVDAMWHAAGDTSADFSWYTRRATLAAIYTTHHRLVAAGRGPLDLRRHGIPRPPAGRPGPAAEAPPQAAPPPPEPPAAAAALNPAGPGALGPGQGGTGEHGESPGMAVGAGRGAAPGGAGAVPGAVPLGLADPGHRGPGRRQARPAGHPAAPACARSAAPSP